jgi:tetratricopeptide (TPR) repeat protein
VQIRSYLIVFAGLCMVVPWASIIAQSNDAAVQAHRRGAVEALQANDLVRAQKEYRAILQLQPENAEALGALGVALYASGSFQEAVTVLERSLALDSSQPSTPLFLALTRAELGQCDRALAYLQKGWELQSEKRLRRLAGLADLECQVTANRYPDALAVAQQLQREYPDDPDVLYRLATLYSRLWNQTATDLIRNHPDSYRVHQLAGEVYEAQQKYDQAIREYSLALKENPRIAGLHARIGQILLGQGGDGSESKAVGEFNSELAINPDSAPAEYALGELYRRGQDYTRAQQHLDRAVLLEPKMPDAHLSLARMYLAEKRMDRSVQEASIAIRLDPQNAAAHYTLMAAYRSQGRMEEAGKEMTVFQQLQQLHQKEFDDKLNTLLTGKRSVVESSN